MSTAPDYVPHWTDTNTASLERSRMQNLALAYECLYCGAPIGAKCTNPRTGQPLSWRIPCHNDRYRYAETGYTPRRTHHANADDVGE